jgi:phenylpropionate dioxygenase-like ring-hydroxylating dioxygenase large terminal subunit
LSQGRVLFPYTLSCPYHGWTYNADGQCVAAIVEGPDSQVPGRVRVRSYPTEERRGVVWGFIGDGEPPPLDEDLPPPLKESADFPQFLFEEWRCNWRLVTENYPDMLHAIFVHRTSAEMVLQKMPAWGTMSVEPLPDGKGLAVRGGGGGVRADYPGLGPFPRRMGFRRFSRRDTRGVPAEVRMPGYIVLPRRRDPIWGHDVATIQWPVPVDEHRTRIFECAITHPTNALFRLALVAWWNAYYRHVHVHLFTHQDRRIMEQQTYRDPERLSVSDVGLVRWRLFAASAARKPSETAPPPQPSPARGEGGAPTPPPQPSPARGEGEGPSLSPAAGGEDEGEGVSGTPNGVAILVPPHPDPLPSRGERT